MQGPRFGGPLAQLVEQLTLNQRVTGSNPVRLTILPPIPHCPNFARKLRIFARFVRVGK